MQILAQDEIFILVIFLGKKERLKGIINKLMIFMKKRMKGNVLKWLFVLKC